MYKSDTGADFYFLNGCMRCKLGGTPQCKVNKWSKELHLLRQIMLDSGLNEEVKWSVPCYTLNNKNLIMINAFKEYACLSFYNGALLSDKKKILTKHGEHSQSVRTIRFTHFKEIVKQTKIIKSYIKEAIETEKSGKKIQLKKNPEPIPEELKTFFEKDKKLESAFGALTPGRQRGYIIYFSGAKQSKTRFERIKKCREKILNGEGLNDHYKK